MAVKERLDSLLVQRGMAPDMDQAQRLVMAGLVRVADQVIYKPATEVPPTSEIRIVERPRYVSRGGEKLEAALVAFNLDVTGRTCADVGASTGGFTDCLLQHGASKIFAIDVGRGILDWKLRQNPQVVVMENTNARQVEKLPQPVSLVTIDASFISLKLLLPVVVNWFAPPLSKPSATDQADIIALVKPQFEAERAQVDRSRGVIRDTLVHRQVLLKILHFGVELGWQALGLIASPLQGAKGNREFLAWFCRSGETPLSLMEMVDLAS